MSVYASLGCIPDLAQDFVCILHRVTLGALVRTVINYLIHKPPPCQRHFGMKTTATPTPAFAATSATPIGPQTPWTVEGISDSPILYRGKSSLPRFPVLMYCSGPPGIKGINSKARGTQLYQVRGELEKNGAEPPQLNTSGLGY